MSYRTGSIFFSKRSEYINIEAKEGVSNGEGKEEKRQVQTLQSEGRRRLLGGEETIKPCILLSAGRKQKNVCLSRGYEKGRLNTQALRAVTPTRFNDVNRDGSQHSLKGDQHQQGSNRTLMQGGENQTKSYEAKPVKI